MTDQEKLADEIATLGKGGGEQSSLGRLLASVATVARDLFPVLERYASTENAYVRQRLAFQSIEVFKRSDRRLALAAAGTLLRLQRVHDAPETSDMVLELATWGLQAGGDPSPDDVSIFAELAAYALECLPVYAIPTALMLCDALYERHPQSLLSLRDRLIPALERARGVMGSLPHDSEVASERIRRCSRLQLALKQQ